MMADDKNEKKESAMERLFHDLKSDDKNTRMWARMTLFASVVTPLTAEDAWKQDEEAHNDTDTE